MSITIIWLYLKTGLTRVQKTLVNKRKNLGQRVKKLGVIHVKLPVSNQ